MKLLQKESRLFKFLHVCALNAMICQVLMPLQNAYAASNTPFLPVVPAKTVSYPAITNNTQKTANVDMVTEAAVLPAPVAAGGPGQPESGRFSLNTTSSMVDPFTGDFSYSIPLMDVEGYPLVISYNSNVGMTDEASWVGLGWNLNVGSVSREMRGLPDDFNGTDKVERTFSSKENDVSSGYKVGPTIGLFKDANAHTTSKTSKIVGQFDVTALIGGYQSAYLGQGNTFDFNIGAQYSAGETYNFKLNGGLGYSRDSKNGIGRSSTVGGTFGAEGDKNSAGLGYNWGSNYNSRTGVQQRSLGASLSVGAKGENMKFGTQLGYGTTFSVGSMTSVPRIQLNSESKLTNVTAQFGVSSLLSKKSKWGYHVGLEVQGYAINENFNYTNYDTKTVAHPAYGYFHSAAAANNTADIPLMDFNRERDGEFSDQMTNLAFSNPTYDVFYVNGLGIQATFRGHRREIGAYGDDQIEKESKGNIVQASGGILLENTTTPGFMLGLSYSHAGGGMTSGEWKLSNDPVGCKTDDVLFFKGIGEPTPTDDQLLVLAGGKEAAAFSISKTESASDVSVQRSNTLNYAGTSSTLTSGSVATATKIDIRANVYAPVLAGEFLQNDPATLDYALLPATGATPLVRWNNSERLKNHVSAIKVLNTDGMNYTYGIPVYSYKQAEVSFSSCTASATGQGLTTYTATENTISNACGRAYLFDKNLVPAYADAFLLTAVTSSDYSDVSGNGFTSDDIGNYYKINHTRLYGDTPGAAYKWRFPVCGGTEDHPELQPKAFFSEGLLSVDSDDMASYSYGEKEIWYTHSLESKNMIAEFVLEDRSDAYGVQGENGVLDELKPLKRLKRIELYNRNERLVKGANAKPVQVVEFIYDYSLCKNNPSNSNTYPIGTTANANSGKLTLKEIRFYSGQKSEEMALTPYKFTYSSINPDFSYQASDRWGKYQPDNVAGRPLELFPYANQNKAAADENSSAWKLQKIDMPSGSTLEVQYESDSYRFVQKKRAMEFVSIEGYSDMQTVGEALVNDTWNTADATNQIYIEGVPQIVVVFELPEPIDAPSITDAATAFREQYLKQDPKEEQGFTYLTEVYLRNFVKIKNGAGFELIPTFAPIAPTAVYTDNGGTMYPYPPTGVLPSNGSTSYKFGYIVLEPVESSEKDKHPEYMNPVLKTAMEFARIQLSDIVYGSCDGCDVDLHIDKKAFWRGDVYKEMAAYGYCNTVELGDQSLIRLFDHDDVHYGGNARVKQITMRDNWFTISGGGGTGDGDPIGEEGGVYHWNYTYEKPREAYGVAAYEPLTGNDENAHYTWSRYTNKSVSFPDESRFHVMPIGELVYPNPVVGYNHVEVRMSHDSGTNVDLGYAVSEYYTAWEEPTKTLSTTIEKVKADWTNYLTTEVDLYGFTQGHTVITNDFHGKPKQSLIYSGSSSGQNTLISRSTYNYKPLGTAVQMLDEKRNLGSYQTGLEYDMHVDSRFVTTNSMLLSIGLVVQFSPALIPTGFTPVLSARTTQKGFYTTCFNKHINYSAVLDNVETETTGSVNTAQSLVYDKYTGNAIVSALTDEYNEALYSVAYPAHWYYTLLRNPLSQPTATVSGTFTTGAFVPTSGTLQDKFSVGDIVNVTIGATTTAVYVLSIDPNLSPEKMKFIKVSDASAFTTSGTGTVVLKKSGRKNMLGPVMQQVITKRNPMTGGFTFPVADIIDASALTLKPRTHIKCALVENPGIQPNSVIDPFKYGVLNNLMTEFQYMMQVERSSAQQQGIRYNGTLVNYVPFYAYNSTKGLWYKVTESGHPNYINSSDLQKWRKSGVVNTVDEFGKPTTVADVLDVPSAALYGYNRMIPTAQAFDAQHFQIAFDSFEDYEYFTSESISNDLGHFDYRKSLNGNVAVVSTEKHSGLKSLSVDNGKAATVTRDITPAEEACATTGYFPKTETNFTATDCRCVKLFEPTPGDYIISLWVKGNAVNSTTQNYSDVSVTVSFTSGTPYTFYPTGQKLDGWQRIEGRFTVPAVAKINVVLNNTSGTIGAKAYFDDLRIHPFGAGMSTTVYDPATLLPMATHDGYNFTTFYNYDENLNQVRMRVETVDGIRTVVESESGSAVKLQK